MLCSYIKSKQTGLIKNQNLSRTISAINYSYVYIMSNLKVGVKLLIATRIFSVLSCQIFLFLVSLFSIAQTKWIPTYF